MLDRVNKAAGHQPELEQMYTIPREKTLLKNRFFGEDEPNLCRTMTGNMRLHEKGWRGIQHWSVSQTGFIGMASMR